MRSRMLIVSILLSLVLGGLLPSGQRLTAQSDEPPRPIRVGSKTFTENELLAQMIILVLQGAGYAVEDYTNYGNTQANRDALIFGQLDVYPEYTGTALNNFYQQVGWFAPDPAAATNPDLSFITVSMMDAVVNDVVWLQRAPANNTFALVVTQAFADANNIHSLSDFARYANEGGTVLLVASEEFALRPDGLPAFEAAYGFDLSGEQMFIIAGVGPDVTEQAVFEGVNGINVAMGYSTDGVLVGNALVVLSDELNAQPVFQPAPIFRGAVIRQYPAIAGLLNPVFATLTTNVLQGLNAQIDVDGVPVVEVARAYLQGQGFLATE